ncbi:hypothetical conserved protein [Candidatus Nitrosoglobus terrae]|uniref:Hypothetical conserved protein n=1 Tax=Candidatus Nitrosoglobus terrae TaxID=1630141 RepID=A0A1Q2SL92_9GAMM|nr:YcfL family protein [Candidatus Nitrosoglobus terrae]BAW79873.1 hypothetical conserved protein [Candidatus Nitrosoglobus terrae]
MKQIWAVLLALVLLAGCSASNMARLESQNGEIKTVVHSNNLLLSSRLAIKNIIISQVGDLMKAQATLENRWKFRLDFQYQFKWFDKNGFEIAPERSPWQQLVMPGRTQANVQALAPNSSAMRFEIWAQE